MDGRPAVRSLSRARGAVLARLSKRECSSLAERPQIRRFAILPSVVLTHDPLPWHVEVPDYEAILEELKLQIKEDPLVDLLEFPPDDISVQSKPRQNRAATCFPEGTSEKESGNLLVEECLKTYNSPENLVCYNYKDYSGDFHHLPKVDLQRHLLVPHVYEVDLDTDKEEENGGVASQMAIVLKKGWLHKGNFTNSSNSVTMKTFKRRYFELSRREDGTHVLQFHKDEKLPREPKGAIFLDSCLGVVENSRIRRHGFEVKMVDGGGLLLAAESASDMDGWRSTLNSLLQSHFHAAMKADNDGQDEEKRPDAVDSPLEPPESWPQLELAPDSRSQAETNWQRRQDGRLNIFTLDAETRVLKTEGSVGGSERRLLCRLHVSCKELRLGLQATLEENEEGGVMYNVEPFFVSLSLYDMRSNRKISGDFHVDLNSTATRGFLPRDQQTYDNSNCQLQAVFTISDPHPDILLVARIEKVLQGSVAQCTEPYLKPGDSKTAQKVLKQARLVCSHLGHYRMPFAWAARQVFHDESGHLDRKLGFSALYRQEATRIGHDDFIRQLSDFHRQEKITKLQSIPGTLDIILEVTRSDNPGHSFRKSNRRQPLCEIDEFVPECAHFARPHLFYANRLYVYPRHLRYDAQKIFPKARNLAVCVEFRDSDEPNAHPLQCIYGKPGSPVFTRSANTAILHHQLCPHFWDEIKIELPLCLHEKHHLLFTFSHVSCDVSKWREGDNTELKVGHAWLPILQDGHVHTGEAQLFVATHLPPGYLALRQQQGTISVSKEKHSLGLASASSDGKRKKAVLTSLPQSFGVRVHGGVITHLAEQWPMHLEVDVKWLDGVKPLFTVGTRLFSTIYTQDPHLHDFFQQCHKPQEMEQGVSSGLVDSIKDLHEIKPQVLIHFLPTLLNQLLRLLTLSIHEDVSINTARLLVHIIDQCQKESCMMYLHSYVKRIFKIEVRDQATDRTTHEALAKALVIFLDPTFDSSFVEKLLKHLWFFYELIHKSMVQYLVQTGLDAVPRGQRFPVSLHDALKAGISNAARRVIQRQREGPEEARLANRSVATFLTHCFSLMDRGFVFCLFNNYANTFSHPDNKTLMEMKFEVLQTLGNYEHFVPLNLPLRPMPKEQAMAQNTCWHMRVNEAFCRRHFAVGLILRELGVALCEGSTELRHPAISTLRGLITKHALDTRYAGQDRQKRVATLYLPLLSLIQECAHRIISMSVGLQQDNLNCKEEILPAGPPRSAGLGLELPAFPFQAGGTLRSSESRISVTSIDSVGSVAERRSTMDCSSLVLQQEKLTKSEVRSLLLVFLHILKHIPPDALLAYWKQLSPANIPGFFSLLEMCVKHFKYCGKNHHGTSTTSDQSHHQGSRSHTAALVRRSQTLPTRRSAHGIPRTARVRSHDGVEVSEALLAAHLSTEVCLTILDVLDLFTTHHKEQLLIDQGDNALMRNVFGVYLAFLQIGQSLAAQAHIFAAFHLFLNQFKLAFFRGRAAMCEALCMEVLRCSCSRLSDVRSHACLLLHLLMRLDFELTGRTGLSRTHTQIVVAVSRLIAEMPELGETRFQKALTLLKCYAAGDNSVRESDFCHQVGELTRRVRDVLAATALMEQQRQDPDALVELHCRLADSYAGVAQLRVAWLDSMARLHMDGDDYPEAAMCNIHIAAIIAECLKREAQQHRGSGEENGLEGEKQWRDCDALKRGSASLVPLSPNVADENPSSGDGGSLQEDHFTEEMFVERIQACAVLLTQAECYELVPIVYKLLVPIYEKKKNYERLSDVYRALHNVYARLITKTRTRLQDSYFRIALFGLGHFDDEEWKEYVYKEPQLTGLSEVSQRFERLYSNKFGADNVRIIQDSNPVDIQLLDPKVAYVQITFVTPLTQNTDGVQLVEPGSRGDVRHFSFETPYTQDGRKHGSVEEQCKRKTILTTSKSFPYICKRIPVLSKHVVDLGPVAVAVDEMQRKLQELRDLCLEPRVNMIQLQLKLQGSICVQVNAGPMTYARAFLQKANASKYPALEVELLGLLFRQFVDTCGEALEINKRLVKEDQREYHADLTEKYKQMVQELSEISDTMAPAVSNTTDNRNSLHLYFNATEQASGNGAAFGAL